MQYSVTFFGAPDRWPEIQPAQYREMGLVITHQIPAPTPKLVPLGDPSVLIGSIVLAPIAVPSMPKTAYNARATTTAAVTAPQEIFGRAVLSI